LQKLDAFFRSRIIGHAGKRHGKGDVFQGSHNLDNIEGLKDITDFPAPEPGQLIGIKLSDIHFVDKHFSGGRFVEPADHVEQGTLSGA